MPPPYSEGTIEIWTNYNIVWTIEDEVTSPLNNLKDLRVHIFFFTIHN